MWKKACLIGVVSLITPFLVTWAEPPADQDRPVEATVVAGPGETASVPPGTVFPETVFAPDLDAEGLRTRESFQRALELRQRMPIRERTSAVCGAAAVTVAGPRNLCDFGRKVAESAPCLAAGDCPAYREWERVMGTPGVREAPRVSVRAGFVPQEAVGED